MDRIFVFFIRLVAITIGFIVASLAAGLAMALLTQVLTPQDVAELAENGSTPGLVATGLIVASVVGYAALLPSIPFIFFAELRKKRDWLFYVLAGGFVGALALGFILAYPQQDGAPSTNFSSVTVACGMIGGLVYWLIAGRHAGGWLPSSRRQGDQRP